MQQRLSSALRGGFAKDTKTYKSGRRSTGDSAPWLYTRLIETPHFDDALCDSGPSSALQQDLLSP